MTSRRSSAAGLCAAVGLTTFTFTAAARAQNRTDPSEAELFEQVFGESREPTAGIVLDVPLRINGSRAGAIPVSPPVDQAPTRADVTALLRALHPWLEDRDLSRIEKLAAGHQMVAVDRLTTLGLRARFDTVELVLFIEVPAGLKRQQTLHLVQRQPRAAEDAMRSARISAYANVYAAADLLLDNMSEADNDQPFAVSTDGALNIYDWVLEGSVSFRQRSPEPVKRGTIALVHDFQQRRLRISLGEVAAATTGFQVPMFVAGLSLAKAFAIQPYRPATPAHERHLFLPSHARLETEVNGRPVRTLELSPGHYRLRDFPVGIGINDVLLRITDEFGRVRAVFFPVAHDGQALAKDETESAVTFGWPWSVSQGEKTYDSVPAQTMFVRHGVTDNLTIGTNLQATLNQAMFGLEALYASTLGTVVAEAALSARAGGDGEAVRVSYSFLDSRQWNRNDHRCIVSFEARGARFAPLGIAISEQPVRFAARASYSRSFPWQLSAGLGVSHSVMRGDDPHWLSANAFIRKRIHGGPTLTLDLSYQLRQDASDFGALVGMSWPLPGTRQFVGATVSPLDQTARVDWERTTERPIGGINTSASTEAQPDAAQVTVSAEYTGQRLEANVSNRFAVAASAEPRRADGTALSSSTTVRLAGALVFADGFFALSRPVNNSFVLLAPVASLSDQQIGVNPLRDDQYVAEIDGWGPAVLPDLAPYQVRNLQLEAHDLPIGLDLGEESFVALPSYKSGTAILVGTDASVFLSGTLTRHDGEPVVLTAGEITSLGEEPFDAVTFFTNRSGRFRVEGLRPGRFELSMYDGSPPLELLIPDDAFGLHDMGALALPPP